jgi:hypothetical protein
MAAQALEIMGSLPELQPAPEDRGEAREAAAAPPVWQPRNGYGPSGASASIPAPPNPIGFRRVRMIANGAMAY